MSCPSTTLAVWAASWLAGASSPDDVIEAVRAWAPMHLVHAGDAQVAVQWDLPWPDPEDAGPVLLLRAVRRLTDQHPDSVITLVLPAPGDVRGLPLGTAFAAAATEAGQGVLLGPPGRPGIGIVPTVDGPDVLRWTAFPVPAVPGPVESMGLGEAEFELREAVRSAAEALASMSGGFSPDGDDPRDAIARALAGTAHHSYPDGTPTRALRIFDTADQVAAILTVAGDPGGRAQSAAGGQAREQTLRPLWSAVRRARLGAVGACLRESLPRT
ncbi:hypothetical protein [Rhodococcus kronopolitis]|uniref:ESX secretion-associated protein EspG n=1 Tax=Rhodococcus kronopolitis TaxID=1460226 RepID=A0ABV9FUV3_9NOCA